MKKCLSAIAALLTLSACNYETNHTLITEGASTVTVSRSFERSVVGGEMVACIALPNAVANSLTVSAVALLEGVRDQQLEALRVNEEAISRADNRLTLEGYRWQCYESLVNELEASPSGSLDGEISFTFSISEPMVYAISTLESYLLLSDGQGGIQKNWSNNFVYESHQIIRNATVGDHWNVVDVSTNMTFSELDFKGVEAFSFKGDTYIVRSDSLNWSNPDNVFQFFEMGESSINLHGQIGLRADQFPQEPTIQVLPGGNELAYVVRERDIQTRENEYFLWLSADAENWFEKGSIGSNPMIHYASELGLYGTLEWDSQNSLVNYKYTTDFQTWTTKTFAGETSSLFLTPTGAVVAGEGGRTVSVTDFSSTEPVEIDLLNSSPLSDTTGVSYEDTLSLNGRIYIPVFIPVASTESDLWIVEIVDSSNVTWNYVGRDVDGSTYASVETSADNWKFLSIEFGDEQFVSIDAGDTWMKSSSLFDEAKVDIGILSTAFTIEITKALEIDDEFIIEAALHESTSRRAVIVLSTQDFLNFELLAISKEASVYATKGRIILSDIESDGNDPVDKPWEIWATAEADFDGDYISDVLDPDDDNDGVPDTEDAFPFDPNEVIDTDGDGIGNVADTDDDGDGVIDSEDEFPLDGSKSKTPEPAPKSSKKKSGSLGFALLALSGLLIARRRTVH